MNRDAISIIGVLASVSLLVATGNLLWFVAIFGFAAYGGWRIGQRVVPADSRV